MCCSEDSLPVVSQLKSLILIIRCDWFGALETQITFSKQCIVISQVRSLLELIIYGSSRALQTQIEFYYESILPFPLISQLISLVFICIGKFNKNVLIN